MIKLIIGIDFGTSTTVVRYRVRDDGNNDEQQIRVHPICDKNNSSCIPSVIFKTKGKTFFGNEALKKKEGGMDGQFLTFFKMMLVDKDATVRQEGKNYTLEFLSFIYGLFVEQTQGLSYEESDIYISYPAKWPPDCVNFMKSAIAQVGFTGTVYGINEPKAASYNFLHKYLSDIQRHQSISKETPLHVFMLDMGAGTSDIVIFKLGVNDEQQIVLDDMQSYPPIGAKALCGGCEIDESLSLWMKDYLREKVGLSQEYCNSLFGAVDAKKWKDDYMSSMLKDNEEICSMPNPIPFAISATEKGPTVLESFRFNRHTFEKITGQHWEALCTMVETAILKYKNQFGIGAEDIDFLLLTGGHSQWYLVPDLFKGKVSDKFLSSVAQNSILNFVKLKADDWRIIQDALSQESVAAGLCVQDETIQISESYPNNVWIKFSVNEKESEIEQVVQSGQIIPIQASNKQGLVLTKLDFIENLNFSVVLDVYVGSSLDQSLHYTYRLSHDAGGLLRRVVEFIVVAFSSRLYTEYQFSLLTNVKIESDGMIDIRGEVRIDDYLRSEAFPFTMDDLVEVSYEIVQVNNK